MAEQIDNRSSPTFAASRPKQPTSREADRQFVKNLLRGMLVVPVVGGVLSICVTFGWVLWAQHHFLDRLVASTHAARDRNDHEAFLLGCRRLTMLVPSDDQFAFELAQAYDGVGEYSRAAEIAARLTPTNGPGHVGARLWRAQKILALPQPSVADLVDAERQVAQVLAVESRNIEARGYACQLGLGGGRLSEAAEHAAWIPPTTRPELRLRLAQALCEVDQQAEARRLIAEVEPLFAAQFNRDRHDPAARLNLAEAQTVQARYAEAVKTLEVEVDDTSSPRRETALGRACLAWARALPQQTVEERQQQEELVARAVEYLQRGLADDSTGAANLGFAYLQQGQPELAQTYVKRADERGPPLLLELARWQAAQGHSNEAQRLAQQATDESRDALQRMPQSEIVRIYAANGESFLRRYEAATELLEAGIITGNEIVLKRAAARVLVDWYDALEQKADVVTRTTLIGLLRRAHRYDPWNLAVIQRWDAQRERYKSEPVAVENIWKDLTAVSKPSLEVLVLLGSRAAQRQEYERALSLLGEAYRRDPSQVEVANGLAWALAHHPSPNLPRALELVTDAVKQNGGPSPELLHTRGSIYAKLENWSAARHDLEAARTQLSNNKEFHAQLAEVYEHLEEPELAREQRRLAEGT